ncbi:MAG: ATP-grasp domain-containing protein [Acidobacteriota bacterium]|nr:ATP-grasp domain-containing protein [Acidobacteriota bacterium]
MKLALLFSSKQGMARALASCLFDEKMDEGEEPPPDLLAEGDSDETIKAVEQALERYHQVIPIEADESAYIKLLEEKPDLVFNMAERLFGPNRESHVPTICEILNIPYTGSDPLTLGLCLDKARAKEIMAYHGLPTPAFWVVDEEDDLPIDLSYPCIVKPLYEGSSKGIKNNSVVFSLEELKLRIYEVKELYKQPAIVERFLSGREFTVGVLGNYPRLEILPIVEIDHSQLPAGARPIYSYEAKWVWDTPDKPLDIFCCPADISSDLEQKIKQVIVKTCRLFRIRDWARIDVRLDENGEPNIIEINPLPGILPKPEDNSCLPKAARAAGYAYEQLINRVVEEASRRYGLLQKIADNETRRFSRSAGGNHGG